MQAYARHRTHIIGQDRAIEALELGRAHDVTELRDLITRVPDVVFEHHGLHNDGVDDYRTLCLVPPAEVVRVFEAVEKFSAAA